MSLIQEIFYIVSNYPGGYKIIYDLIYDGQAPGSEKSRKRLDNTLRVTLSRLNKKGLIKNIDGKWVMTKAGKAFLASKAHSLKQVSLSRKPNFKSKNQLIVAFDIPEKKKRYREWLRAELVEGGFEPVQKSIWLGPALPKEFIEYLNELDLLKHIRFFNVTKDDLI